MIIRLRLFRYVLLLAITMAMLIPGIAHGLGQGMYTLKYVDGPNLILVTPNIYKTESGIPIQYNLRLYNEVGQPVNFTNAHSEVWMGDKQLTSQNLRRSPNNDTTLFHTYKKQGLYTIKVTFMDNSKKVAAGEFPITVTKGKSFGFFSGAFTIQTGVAFLLGMLVCLAFVYYKTIFRGVKRAWRVTQKRFRSLRKTRNSS